MLPFFIALCLTCFPAEDVQKPVDPELVRVALLELQAAFDSHDSADQIAQIQKHQELMDVQVADAIAKGLKDNDMAVRKTTIEALRWMHFPSAVKALNKALRSDKRIQKDEEVLVALIRAVGQHGDSSSIELLADGMFSSPSAANVEARIYSLGHIRHVDALDTLMDLLQRNAGLKTKGNDRNTLQAQYDVALEAMTGQTFKGDPQLWLQWWRKNKKTFELAPEQPAMSPKAASVWLTYWSKPSERRERERSKERRKQPQ